MGAGGSLLQLTWIDGQGKVAGTIGDKGAYGNPAVSPDGAHIAVTRFDPQKGNSNIWVFDTSRGTNTRLTFSAGRDDVAVWSPDSKRIVFASNRNGHFDLYEKPADGSSEERLLLKSDNDKRPTSWSRDGRHLIYSEIDPKTQEDLWVLPLPVSGYPEPAAQKPIPFLQTPFRETLARFSPDGRFVAYSSNESGTFEVYVRPFSAEKIGESASSGKWMVSKGGGGNPHWRADGKELFYIYQLQQWAVDVTTDKVFQAGIPKRLFNTPPIQTAPDVAADGQRFLYVALEGTNNQTPFTIVLNWQAGLKK